MANNIILSFKSIINLSNVLIHKMKSFIVFSKAGNFSNNVCISSICQFVLAMNVENQSLI